MISGEAKFEPTPQDVRLYNSTGTYKVCEERIRWNPSLLHLCTCWTREITIFQTVPAAAKKTTNWPKDAQLSEKRGVQRYLAASLLSRPCPGLVVRAPWSHEDVQDARSPAPVRCHAGCRLEVRGGCGAANRLDLGGAVVCLAVLSDVSPEIICCL